MLNQEFQTQQQFDSPKSEGAVDVAQKRLEILALARELGNVRKACQRAGISRSRFYELKNMFDQQGAAGLKPQPRRKPRMPNQTPPEMVEPILNMTARYPTYSYIRISEKLRAGACDVAPSTVRLVWEQRGLNSCLQRLMWLKHSAGALPPRYTRLLQKLSTVKDVPLRKPVAQEAGHAPPFPAEMGSAGLA
jgi:hypothetical protein